MQRLMFQTFGLGGQIVDSSIYAIKVYNPDHLVLFSTEDARRRSLGRLLDRLHGDDSDDPDSFEQWRERTDEIEASNQTWSLNWKIQRGTFDGLTVSVPTADDLERFNNAERLHLAYQRLIEDAFARFVDHPDQSIPHAIADYTRGTRPMSAALFGAAYASGLPLIAYVGGERDDAGFVIPGTETIHQTQGQRLRAADRLDEAVRLFNAGDFSAASGIAESLERTPSPQLPFEGSGVSMVAAAARAFGAWDRFRFGDALEALQQLGDDLDPNFVGEHLMTKREREHMQRHLYQAHQAASRDEEDQTNATRSHVGLAADLVANADRRIQAEAYDDALGRLYRALEYLAQVRIRNQFDVSTESVPMSLLERGFGDEAGQADRDADDARAIGMKEAWDLLGALEDELGQRFEQLCDETDLLVSIGMRNSSILAHGFDPVDPEYVDVMRGAVIELAHAHWGEQRWSRALETCRFPEMQEL